jgi:branched-chain amino acid transport system permease protein
MGTVWGPVVGALFVFALPNLLASLPFATGNEIVGVPIRSAASIVYGVVIIVVFLTEPGGIVGIAKRVRPLLSRTTSPSTEEARA